MAGGEVAWVDAPPNLMRAPEGALLYFVPSGVNVSGRRRAEWAYTPAGHNITEPSPSAYHA